MSAKRTKIIKELDPNEVKGFSQARIQHYLQLGYKPYLDEYSEVKWLTQAQRSMRDAKIKHVSLMQRVTSKRKYNAHRRKMHKSGFLFSILVFWPILVILIVIAAALLVLINYPHLIF
ncbi:MAG: hypothetical protein PHN71_04030 [Candidatus Cloacimonetes bacterium]|nr:hypothetical protein [Candidatus Cloacimonadota bacterium]MDY0298935.1 hypothetical protein [Candidatus Cloacimonadaceae bacterium]MCB5279636.1 hypothetical protein [Candidatus Cloacimonadota bacterium]MCK9333487.1 hypothetical protein [Candidatus Cloacimonadota bacterium]MDD2210473.1 hypothetical protein [Candidatus Cloacimonadota bacterium]